MAGNFHGAQAICIDPKRLEECFFVGGSAAITHCDVQNRIVRMSAGGNDSGFSDGVGSAVQVHWVTGMLHAKSDIARLFLNAAKLGVGSRNLRSVADR